VHIYYSQCSWSCKWPVLHHSEETKEYHRRLNCAAGCNVMLNRRSKRCIIKVKKLLFDFHCNCSDLKSRNFWESIRQLLPTPTAVAGVRYSLPFVCVSFFPHGISKIDVAKITKLDTQMFHYASWKPIYVGVKRSRLQKHHQHGSLHFRKCWLLLSSFAQQIPNADSLYNGNKRLRYSSPAACTSIKVLYIVKNK